MLELILPLELLPIECLFFLVPCFLACDCVFSGS